jgi:hypothetical protein
MNQFRFVRVENIVKVQEIVVNHVGVWQDQPVDRMVGCMQVHAK